VTGPLIQRIVARGERPIPPSPEAVRRPLDHALYYAPVERAACFSFLRREAGVAVPLADLARPAAISPQACSTALSRAGVRVAIVDVTAPDVARGPYRVARALGVGLQPIHYGAGLERTDNPRLRMLLDGAINPDPHPIC
jgi:ribosomal protein S12 methylthiotransferase accessory factor